MTDRRVSISLTFDTDTPAPDVALAVTQAVHAHVPYPVEATHAHEFDLAEIDDSEPAEMVRLVIDVAGAGTELADTVRDLLRRYPRPDSPR
ncbi:hypothetical protein [Streptomyces sp. RTd22]|uniref:hypothetical protein n=1 Tax=Streptomyces sp. RTd22 TaxID=1841249 RepID=UPI0007C4965B|nr:hypothetical protein [Streptomyces sp. RTd22]